MKPSHRPLAGVRQHPPNGERRADVRLMTITLPPSVGVHPRAAGHHPHPAASRPDAPPGPSERSQPLFSGNRIPAARCADRPADPTGRSRTAPASPAFFIVRTSFEGRPTGLVGRPGEQPSARRDMSSLPPAGVRRLFPRANALRRSPCACRETGNRKGSVQSVQSVQSV